MRVKENINRFCFGLPTGKETEKYISSILKYNTINKTTPDTDIENFDIFYNDSFYFFIIDVRQHIDIKEFKRRYTGLDRLELLGRIFKKDTQKKYLAKNTYKRIVMTLELENDPGLLETYKDIHREDKIWLQIIKNMTTIGVLDMEIYLLGNLAFLIMDTTLNFDMIKDGERWLKLPREKEWQQYVAKFQKVNPKSKITEKWKIMTLAE